MKGHCHIQSLYCTLAVFYRPDLSPDQINREQRMGSEQRLVNVKEAIQPHYDGNRSARSIRAHALIVRCLALTFNTRSCLRRPLVRGAKERRPAFRLKWRASQGG